MTNRRTHATELTEQRVRAIVREELRRMFGRLLSDDRIYSSRASHGPVGYSREAWRQLAKRIGVKRGRWWIVTHEQLEAYEQRQRLPQADAVASAKPSSWHPSQIAIEMGWRPVRG